ncbi:PEF-CTERM sorting domain-containing protein [uncultured Methanolobus sp.]|uniref:PEF-CTERM sorting domain-containing protein n=1 Tax=uncultured Methanolobus sp. TaxID=218300 RepID=UPI002AABF2C7|nr:PEF-CTERM sorting domain-containing protein [uncultured Methanolobus sp.]
MKTKTNFNVKRVFALSIASIFLLTATLSMTAMAADDTVVIPYGDSGYTFKIVDKDEAANFADPDFDDSGFTSGATAGFGSIYSGCVLTDEQYVKTEWPVNSYIAVRKEFYLPAGTSDMKISVAIDNDVQVFVNGVDVSNGMQTHDGCPSWGSFVFEVDDSILQEGTNLIAIRGKDRGSASFLDIKVTADVPDTEEIPEFPTIALPIAAIIGLAFIFKRE